MTLPSPVTIQANLADLIGAYLVAVARRHTAASLGSSCRRIECSPAHEALLRALSTDIAMRAQRTDGVEIDPRPAVSDYLRDIADGRETPTISDVVLTTDLFVYQIRTGAVA
jgi:hypothetical protein